MIAVSSFATPSPTRDGTAPVCDGIMRVARILHSF